jgi:hypothetical protein
VTDGPHAPVNASAAPPGSRSTACRVAAAVCAVQAVVFLACGLYYLGTGTFGHPDDRGLTLSLAVLTVLLAVGLGALARLWRGGSEWAATPTVVWHLLLIAVAVSMFQGGQWLIGVGIVTAIVLAVGATVASRRG